MDKRELAFLLQSGFTVSEIMGLVNPSDHAEDPAPAPAPEPEPEPALVQAPAAQPAGDSAVLAAIENLTKTIQAGNIRAGGFPAPDGGNTAENILANIINPPGYAGDK